MNSTDIQSNPAKPSGIQKALNPLMIMIVVFGLPYVLAWYFLYGGDPTEFEAPNNQGVLVSPMQALPAYSLELLNGDVIKNTDLSGNWLLFTTTQSCDEQCKRTLLIVRQARKAMAVDREIIKPILLLSDNKALANMDIDLSAEFPQLAIIKPESAEQSQLLAIFSQQVETLNHSIFMVDPFGNFMMVYPAGSEQLGLLDDMKRLLKVNPSHR